jgi:hypothetical protein
MEWGTPAPILIEVVILIILSVASEGRVIDSVQRHSFRSRVGSGHRY